MPAQRLHHSRRKQQRQQQQQQWWWSGGAVLCIRAVMHAGCVRIYQLTESRTSLCAEALAYQHCHTPTHANARLACTHAIYENS